MEGSEVIVTLEKRRKTWWKHVIVGHPEIDTSKVRELHISYTQTFQSFSI
jgi:hypothetical protein